MPRDPKNGVDFVEVFANGGPISNANPLPITGGGSNASVGATGATAPTSATEVGIIDSSGKLQGASSANPVSVDPTGTTVQPVSGTFYQATQPISGSINLIPATSGGVSAWDIFGNTLTDSSQEVKSSPGQFYGYTFFNPNAVTVYLMVYSASETCGSATNRVLCMGIPAGAGANIQFSDGIACATTIYAAISTAVNSAAAPVTQCVGTLYYA